MLSVHGLSAQQKDKCIVVSAILTAHRLLVTSARVMSVQNSYSNPQWRERNTYSSVWQCVAELSAGGSGGGGGGGGGRLAVALAACPGSAPGAGRGEQCRAVHT